MRLGPIGIKQLDMLYDFEQNLFQCFTVDVLFQRQKYFWPQLSTFIDTLPCRGKSSLIIQMGNWDTLP